MNVGVFSSFAPFESTASDTVAGRLVGQLQKAGHETEHIRLPFSTRDAAATTAAIVAVRLLTLIRLEVVIALDFPAYCVRHPRKVVWMPLKQGPAPGAEVDPVMRNAEAAFLPEAAKLRAGSRGTVLALGRLGLSASLLREPNTEAEWEDAISELLG